jgi:imidazole glycerol phosphate synthase glutamine amidotransferase subunit
MIAVIDYGAGNLRSVVNALDEISVIGRVVSRPEDLVAASKIILPGVGHFGQMMRALDSLGLRNALVEQLKSGTPFLGVCLGFHALLEGSEEAPEARGLGLLPGRVQRFPAGTRVPHMGWNQLNPENGRRPSLLEGISSGAYVYFAHSYYVPLLARASATCTYCVPFTAAIAEGNLSGVQFHPEKSGAAGLRILQNFAER